MLLLLECAFKTSCIDSRVFRSHDIREFI